MIRTGALRNPPGTEWHHAVAQAPGTSDESIALFDYYYDQKSASYQMDGRGNPKRTVHDGYGRVATVIDAVSGGRFNDYDPSGNVVHTYFVGDPGPAPPDEASGPSPSLVMLSEESADFDERERRTAHQARFFRREQPILGQPEETIYNDGDSDGWVTTVTTYDRESRVVTVRNDNWNETFTAFDGMGRPILVQDAAGHTVESTYNASGSPTLVRSNEMDQSFDTTSEYDAAGRAVRVTDNEGCACS